MVDLFIFTVGFACGAIIMTVIAKYYQFQKAKEEKGR